MAKSSAQLDREIAAALVAGPSVKISVHETDSEEDVLDESYVVSDDGGEFDDSEEIPAKDVQGAIDERRLYYRQLGRKVVLQAPARLDLQ